jgi:hypothetical protein
MKIAGIGMLVALASVPLKASADASVKWTCKSRSTTVIVTPTGSTIDGKAFTTSDASISTNSLEGLDYSYAGDSESGARYTLSITNVVTPYASVMHEAPSPEVGRGKLQVSDPSINEENLFCTRM